MPVVEEGKAEVKSDNLQKAGPNCLLECPASERGMPLLVPKDKAQ
jgi:hypothetical protein